jgi:hypothetical protein
MPEQFGFSACGGSFLTGEPPLFFGFSFRPTGNFKLSIPN